MWLYRAPLVDCFYSTEKYFTNKIENNSLRKEKKRTTTTHAELRLNRNLQVSYPFAV